MLFRFKDLFLNEIATFVIYNPKDTMVHYKVFDHFYVFLQKKHKKMNYLFVNKRVSKRTASDTIASWGKSNKKILVKRLFEIKPRKYIKHNIY
jgi:hypothetical protein